MITLTQAIKESGRSKDYILHLIKKGRIAYATDDTQSAYIVSLDDINYHTEQVRYRRMSPKALAYTRQKHQLESMGLTANEIRKYTDVQPFIKVAKSVKRVTL